MKFLQKLGKALMLPVAVLPICGILMGIGYALAPGVMGVPAVSGNDAGRRYLGRSKPDRSVSRKSRSSSDRQHGTPLCNRRWCRYVRKE